MSSPIYPAPLAGTLQTAPIAQASDPPLARTLQALHRNVDILEGLTEACGNRFAALTAVRPELVEKPRGGAPPPGTSALVMELTAVSARLDLIAIHLQELLERAEL